MEAVGGKRLKGVGGAGCVGGGGGAGGGEGRMRGRAILGNK